ncbi:MAG: hypothetical protein D3908_02965 [Candidatus Electrothrix sp. AUS4]|nr:hypothetical protein [Candidatus Electrothrix sp. AUS4]
MITKGSSPTWQGINYVDKPGVLFVTSENVREGYLDLTKKKFLEPQFNDIQARSILKQNDVLVNIVGASIGRATVYPLSEPANINQAVALIRCKKDKIEPKYLNKFLNSPEAIKIYDSMKKEVARANLSLQNISDLLIPSPPLSKQQELVKKIEKIETKIAELEATIANIPAQKEAILRKYL